jgi:hypothetical protein
MHGVASVADRSVQKIIQGYSTSGAVYSFAAGKRAHSEKSAPSTGQEGAMKKLLLTFLVFMAAWPANAGMQGNLPTSVQKLPTYPPVVCVAANWETETCESRQTLLPRPNPLRALGRAVERPKTLLYDEPGGDYWEHWNRFRALAQSGDDVEIRGSCASGCTLIMVHVPSDRLCFGEYASLKFHVARDPKSGEPNMAFTQQRMVNQYPQDIYWWIKVKGGVEKMTIEQMWTLDASELWRMGYRKCAPEEAPAPMTKIVPAHCFFKNRTESDARCAR